MSSPLELYRLQLPVSGKLKFRAMVLMARGEEEGRIEAAAMLREAARIERRCVEMLPDASPETRLGAVIEECGCLVTAGDPPGAAEAWSRVLRDSRDVSAEVAESMLSRIDPRYRKMKVRFQNALGKMPIFKMWFQDGGMLLQTTRERKKLEAELSKLTAEFPGFPLLWWKLFTLAFADGRLEDARLALDVFGKLEPRHPFYQAEQLTLKLLLFPDRKSEILDESYRRIDHAPAELCYAHAMGEVDLARATGTKDHWARAQTAASEGLKRNPPEHLRQWLRAIASLADYGRQGLTPTCTRSARPVGTVRTATAFGGGASAPPRSPAATRGLPPAPPARRSERLQARCQ